MSERGLRERLRAARPPGAEEAERRARAVARAALGEAPPRRRRRAPVVVGIATALAAAVLGLALARAPAPAVGDWVRALVRAEPRPAPRPLTALPAPGRLLVRARAGTWTVARDGARRRLGRFDDAAWSAPLGRFVAAARGRELLAVDLRGTPRWAVARHAAVADPRWAPDGLAVAFRAGRALHVVAGDGTGGERLSASVAPVAPAWRPGPGRILAWADARGRVLSGRAQPGARVRREGRGAVPVALGWTPAGSLVVVRPGGVDGRWRAPAGARVVAAALAGRGVALLLRRAAGGSEVRVLDLRTGAARRLLAVAGELRGVTWSPDRRRLLVGWPALDQWLVLAADGRGRPAAIGDLRRRFGGDPVVEGWVR